MPYGIDKKLGGDSKENEGFMEKCVNGISGKNPRTNKPYTKGEKIAICKTQLKKKKAKSEFVLDLEALYETIDRLESYKRYLVGIQLAENEAEATAQTEVKLARVGFDIEKLF